MASQQARRNSFRRLRAAALGLIVSLMLCEGGLRILGLGNPVLYVSDSDCGYLPAPNQNVHRFFRLNHTNAFSMRSADITAQKPTGAFRVMFVGDSVTYGTTFVDQADIFTSILQRELPGLLHRSVEVLNASAGAWAPGNEAGYLQSHGTFGADLIVFVLNTGDLNQPFQDQALTLASGYPAHDPPLALWEAWVRYVRPRLGGPRTADAGSQAGDAPSETIESARILDSLHAASSICAAAGVRFSILYVPSHGAGWDAPVYHTGLAELASWAAANNVPLVSAASALSQASPQAVYFDGIHLRPAGDRVVAQTIEQNWKLLAGSGNPTTQP